MAQSGREQPVLTPTVHLWPASACLIRELANELATFERSVLAKSLVVLPTKRLGNWLIALLAEKLGAFLPPRILTLDEMLQQFAPPPSAHHLHPLTPFEDQQLVAELIETGGFRHLRSGHEHEICQLFKELIDWQLEDVAFARLEQAARTSAHSEPGLNTLTERIIELEALYTQRATRLAQASAIPTNVLTQARCLSLAQAITEHNGIPGIEGLVYVVGLSSAKALHAPLFRAMSRCSRIQLWFNDPSIGLRRGPLERLLEFVDAPTVQRQCTEQRTGKIQTLAASSPLAEAALAVELVSSAIRQGCLPSHIALLVADDHSYAAPIRYLMAQASIKANFAITAPLAQTRLGSWLAALVACLRAPEESQIFLNLLVHPATRCWLRAKFANIEVGSLASLDAVIGYGAFGAPRSLSAILHEQQHTPHLATANGTTTSKAADLYQLSLHTLAEFLRPLTVHKKRPLAEHAAAWRLVISEIAAAVEQDTANDQAAAGITQSVNTAIAEFFAEIDGSNSHLIGHLSATRFVQIVADNLLQRDVRSVGDQLAGVQVLSIEEARYVPFRLAIILGCNEGRLPRALPKDRLIDNYLKTQAGLPGWQLLEAIEDTTFRLLAARLPHLCLSYAESDGKDELVRSRFIETLLAEGKAKALAGDGELALRRLIDGETNLDPSQARCTSKRSEGELPQAGQQLAERMQRMSATSLEALLRCPYQYLLRHLKVEALEFKDKQKAKDEGELLHAILEAFFKDRSSDIEPLPEAQAWPDFPKQATRRLVALTRRLAPPDFIHSSLYRHLRGFAWPALARHLHQIYTPDTWVKALLDPLRELRFGGPNTPKLTAEINGRRIALTGSIDAIDPIPGMTIVTDFKRRGLPDNQLARFGLAPQLILYAHALQQLRLDLPEDRFHTANMVIGYWSIQLGTWHSIAAGKDVLASAKQLGLIGARTKTTLEDIMSLMFEHWRWRDQQIIEVEQAFRADPSACGFCSYAGICRKDDPRWAETMANRALLQKRISAISDD